jgi:PAS domain S-box-containing protein
VKEDSKTKKQLVDELTELRSQNAALKNSITGIISYELAAEEARRYAESIVETVREPLLVLDADLKIISANRNFYRTFKVIPGETIGSFIYDLGNKQWDIPKLRELLEEVLPEKEAFDDFEVAHNFQNIGHKIMLLNARQIYRKDINTKIILLAIEDITERRKFEEAHNNLAAIVESADDAIIGKDLEGIIVSWNRGAEIAYGYNAKEVIGKSISLLMPPGHPKEYKELLTKRSSGELIKNYETQRMRKDGKIVDVSLTISPVKDTSGEITGDSIIVRDITERKRLESLLIDSEQQYRRLFETASDGIVLLEKREGKITQANPATEKLLGYTEKDSIGNSLQDIGVMLDTSDFQTTMQNLNKSGIINYRNVKVETKSGQHIDTEIYLVDRAKLVQCNIRDITEHKRAEEVLRESEERYRVLFEGSTYGILITDIGTGRFVDANLSICRMLGYSKAELLQLGIEDIHPKNVGDHVMSEIESQVRGEKPVSLAIPCLRKDGTVFHADIVGANTFFHGRRCAVGFLMDITERNQAEADLKQAEERYRSIFENAQEGIFRSTPDGKMIMANQAMAKMFGYASPEELITGITDVARQHYVNPEDRRKIKEMLEAHGFIKGYEAQNNRKDGSIIWISLTMHAVRDEKGQVMYYDSLIEDITDRKQKVERIRKALGSTVQAIAVTVETRDPYTAGHQRRVADLARSIATEMNLPAEQIDGIRMAATIHDLGKISVPAEILSKPTKLTALEFSLIKTHAQSGHDILQDIDFPWPVAKIVLEHHERMDGSGYPNGLSGDNILMESRILAVADVVESMASHRPYRPSLGIEAALEELEKNKGTLYDNTVADACLRLFREKRYKLQ